MAETSTLPAKGHNNPPSLLEVLSENNVELTRGIEELAERANALPRSVKNDEALDKVSVVYKDARAMLKRIDARRVEEKEPHLKASRDIDGFFKGLAERVDRIAKTFGQIADDYVRQKAAEEKRKAEAEARKAREAEEAARRKAREAEEAGKETVAGRAETRAEIQADKAEEAERRAEASTAELARTRGASGSVVSARTTRKIRVTDLGAVQQTLGPLGPYIASEAIQKAANAWLKFNASTPAPAGLEVFEDVKANIR